METQLPLLFTLTWALVICFIPLVALDLDRAALYLEACKEVDGTTSTED
jgi:hypothetical protein